MTELARNDLEDIAGRIRIEYARSRDALGDALDSYFAIGHLLLDARVLLPSNNVFGAWFRDQAFGFTRQWALVLRDAAEYEPDVRGALTSQLVNGAPNLDKAVKQVRAALGGGRDERPTLELVQSNEAPVDTPPVVTYSTIVIDPPWRYDNSATRAAAADHYPTMTVAELAALKLPAAGNSHLYLWVTNSFVREGFELLDAWRFTYKTMLTWAKPSIGMGNYFRNSTEHVLFAVRGRLPMARKDVGTWFTAKRGQHSAKPEAFYDLVEACSPGPHLEMFARRRRMGWHTWGNEA